MLVRKTIPLRLSCYLTGPASRLKPAVTVAVKAADHAREPAEPQDRPKVGNTLLALAHERSPDRRRLAARVGVSPDAVRHYERLGLLPPPERSMAGYQRYDERAVQRLRFVQGAQRVGLRLREIAELLEIVDPGPVPLRPHRGAAAPAAG
jgi:MerR HTH family regulatory protein